MDVSELEAARLRRLARLDEHKPSPQYKVFDANQLHGFDMLQTSIFSDFVVECASVIFKVHKSQLFAKSSYFKALFSGPYEENANAKVVLKDTTPTALGMLLLIVYVAEGGQWLDQVYKMWPYLQKIAEKEVTSDHWAEREEYLKEHFALEFRTMIDVYCLADRLLMEDVAAAAAKFITNYIRCCGFSKIPTGFDLEQVLGHIYSATGSEDEKLRAETTLICVQQYEVMKESPAIKTIPEENDGYVFSVALRACGHLSRSYAARLEKMWPSNINSRWSIAVAPVFYTFNSV